MSPAETFNDEIREERRAAAAAFAQRVFTTPEALERFNIPPELAQPAPIADPQPVRQEARPASTHTFSHPTVRWYNAAAA